MRADQAVERDAKNLQRTGLKRGNAPLTRPPFNLSSPIRSHFRSYQNLGASNCMSGHNSSESVRVSFSAKKSGADLARGCIGVAHD